MASVNGQGPIGPADVQRFHHKIPNLTVVELKGLIRDFGTRCHVRIAISGTKPQLINRVSDQVDSWAQAQHWHLVREALRLANAPRDSKGAVLTIPGSASSSAPRWGGGHAGGSNTASHNGYPGSAPGSSSVNGSHVGSDGGGQGAPGYQKLASQVPSNKRNVATSRVGHSGYVGQAGTSSAVRTASYAPSKLHFKPSPFFKVEQWISSPVVLLEAGAQQRRTATIDLRLTAAHAAMIKNNSDYQARLFCTTKGAAEIAERNVHHAAQIEFPMSCEARINGTLYNANLKGSKKNPGRVPPPNLNKDKTLMTRDGMVNKIELVYANVQQKYVMAVALCKYTSVESIVQKLKQEKRRSRDDIIGSMKRAAAEDDLEIGTSTLSLRDPLSYTRIQAPVRSLQCPHSQCFDASFFFMSNEQAPTWTCPHCSRTLKPEELFIDGYFEDILLKVPEDQDYVEVDADGTWRTRDGKISSSNGHTGPADARDASKETQPAVRPKPEQDAFATALPPLGDENESASVQRAPPAAEIVCLDDTPTPPPEVSCGTSRIPNAASASANTVAGSGPAATSGPSHMGPVTGASPSNLAGPSTSLPPAPVRPPNSMVSTTSGASAGDAIDLTLSDSDDDTPSPVHHARPSRPIGSGIGGGDAYTGLNLHPAHEQQHHAQHAGVNGHSNGTGHVERHPVAHSSIHSRPTSSFMPPSSAPSWQVSSSTQNVRPAERRDPSAPASTSISAHPPSSRPFMPAAPPDHLQVSIPSMGRLPSASSEANSFGTRMREFLLRGTSQGPHTPIYPPAASPTISAPPAQSNGFYPPPISTSAPPESANRTGETALLDASANSLLRARTEREDDIAESSTAHKRVRRSDSDEGPNSATVDATTPRPSSATYVASASESTPLPSVSPSPPPTSPQPIRPGRRIVLRGSLSTAGNGNISSPHDDGHEESEERARAQDDQIDDEEEEPIRRPGRQPLTSSSSTAADEFDELDDSVFDSLDTTL